VTPSVDIPIDIRTNTYGHIKLNDINDLRLVPNYSHANPLISLRLFTVGTLLAAQLYVHIPIDIENPNEINDLGVPRC